MRILFAIFMIAVFLAPSAKADQWDYISYLDAHGVAYNGDVLGMIETGKSACHGLRAGADPSKVFDAIGRQGFAPYEISTIVAAAVNQMCPDQRPTMVSFINSLG